MRNVFASNTVAAAVGAMMVLLTMGCSGGEDQPASEVDLPALGAPDLSGIWQAFTTASWNLEDHNAQKGEPGGQGVVEGGSIPYQSSALATRMENYDNRMTMDPVRNCYMPGVPRVTYMPFPFQIVQTPTLITILYEYNNLVRWIWLDGREHPGALEFWMGESRGHWEGNTLVVEVRNHNDRTWFDAAGNFHTEALRVVERYTPIDQTHISYEVTIEDPNVFTEPWTISLPLYRRLERDVQLLDYNCLEYETPFLPWDEPPAPGLAGPPER